MSFGLVLNEIDKKRSEKDAEYIQKQLNRHHSIFGEQPKTFPAIKVKAKRKKGFLDEHENLIKNLFYQGKSFNFISDHLKEIGVSVFPGTIWKYTKRKGFVR